MFSTSNPALVTHSDGMFTRQSASTNGTNDDLQSDLIAFLSVVQKYNVDYLPITWQAALSNLGEGGSGTVSQSTFNADMPLAFKRFHDPDGDVSDKYFLPLISEVLILSQPAIRNHPHIVNLEGICWEIKPRTEKAVPVLVFEKAVWDLQQYMKLRDGINMSIVDRLKICAEVGSAIQALHAYDVIHGDIKPQNVLVFKDATGKTTIKMADFGYSTLAAGGTGEVFLPKSTPWNAPEHHWEGFKVPDAKKTDVYSFGLLCLWVLFGTSLRDIPRAAAGGATELLSSNTPLGPSSFLERLNGEGEGEMQRVAEELVHTVPGLDAEHKMCLKEFFNLTVVHNPDHRTLDINKLLDLLMQEPTISHNLVTPLQTVTELTSHEDFRLAENLIHLVVADYRVRIQIRVELEKKYVRNQNQPSAAHIAFQLAFCYQIGFGVKSDDNASSIWLEKSNKRSEDLEAEKTTVRPAGWKSKRMLEFGERLFEADVIHEYRTWGLDKLEEARREYERELGDMAREFGGLHFIPLALIRIFGDLLNELGQFEKSIALQMRIRKEIEDANGIEHPDTLTSMSNLAIAFRNQGRWDEAEELFVQVMEIRKRASGEEHPETIASMSNLASTYSNQGRWKEAEELEVQVMEIRKRVFGLEHPDSLSSMSNLASIYSNQGRWNEAKVLQVHVVETEKRIFGEEHPSILVSISNLASIYGNLGQWNEAEKLFVQVLETERRALGEEHPDTLTSVNNLASTYVKLGRWKEAEELFLKGMETEQRVLGNEHPDTLTTMSNLAETYRNQGQWEEAEELFVQVLEIHKRRLGNDHPDTLSSMDNVASTYRKRGRWKEAEELLVQIMETEMRVRGQEHPATLTSMGNLASTYSSQRRWKEAEKLEVQVMEAFKRLLGQEHPDTLAIIGNLASTYSNQEQWEKAKVLQVQVMETLKKVHGQEHPDTLTSMNNLAHTYSKQDRWEEAEELFVQAMETNKRVFGEEHPSTLTFMVNLAITLKSRGRMDEAMPMMMKVVILRSQKLGNDHPATQNAIQLLDNWSDGQEIQSTDYVIRFVSEDSPDYPLDTHN